MEQRWESRHKQLREVEWSVEEGEKGKMCSWERGRERKWVSKREERTGRRKERERGAEGQRAINFQTYVWEGGGRRETNKQTHKDRKRERYRSNEWGKGQQEQGARTDIMMMFLVNSFSPAPWERNINRVTHQLNLAKHAKLRPWLINLLTNHFPARKSQNKHRWNKHQHSLPHRDIERSRQTGPRT